MPPPEVKDHLAPVLDHPTPEDRARALREELAYHEHRLHVLEHPVITGLHYQRLRAELAALEREKGVRMTFDSATLRAGLPPRAQLEKVRLARPWLDPPVIASPPELERYCAAIQQREGPEAVFVGSPKLAAVDVVLTYVQGFLQRAVLRGDGQTGEDITDNVRTLGSVPLRLRPPGTVTESRVTKLTKQALGPSTMTPVPPFPEELHVAGGLTARTTDLLAVDRERVDAGDAPFVDPRAAAHALVRRLDPRATATEPLRFFAVDTLTAPTGIDSYWQLLGALKSWGFRVSPLAWRCVGAGEVLAFVNALLAQKAEFEYPIDGGVLRANSVVSLDAAQDPMLPRRVHLSFATPGREAQVTSVYRAVSRTGAVLPVVLLKPLGAEGPPLSEGVSVPAASGSAPIDVRDGALVTAVPGGVVPILRVERQGDGPPQVVDPSCPACRAPLTQPIDQPFASCDNPACKGKARARLLHWLGPRGLNVKALNLRTAETLIPQAASLADLFVLDPGVVERASPGSGEPFRAEMWRWRRIALWRVLFLASIPHIGEREARAIASFVLDVEGVYALARTGWAAVPGVNLDAQTALFRWLSHEGPTLLERLRGAGVEVFGELESFAAPFLDKHVAFAGTFDSMPRDVAAEELERRGAILEPRVSRTSDLVVCGRDSADARELADHYHVPVVEEGALAALLRYVES